jgi:hypothetical protein
MGEMGTLDERYESAMRTARSVHETREYDEAGFFVNGECQELSGFHESLYDAKIVGCPLDKELPEIEVFRGYQNSLSNTLVRTS